MSEPIPVDRRLWPPAVPLPGNPSWEHKALIWLAGQVPGNAWIHEPIASRHGWYIATSAEVHIQRDLQIIREAWTQAGRMRGILGGMSVQGIQAAAEREARRLKKLLEQVIEVEKALSSVNGPGVRRPRP